MTALLLSPIMVNNPNSTKKRKRFRVNKLASSDNYRQSIKSRHEYLKEFHDKNKDYIESLSNELPFEPTKEPVTTKTPYIKVFGVLMVITAKEAVKLHTTETIIWL